MQGAGEVGQRLAERYANRMPTNAVRGSGSQDCPPDYPVKGKRRFGAVPRAGVVGVHPNDPGVLLCQRQCGRGALAFALPDGSGEGSSRTT